MSQVKTNSAFPPPWASLFEERPCHSDPHLVGGRVHASIRDKALELLHWPHLPSASVKDHLSCKGPSVICLEVEHYGRLGGTFPRVGVPFLMWVCLEIGDLENNSPSVFRQSEVSSKAILYFWID